jgi:hypothetical protein
MVYMVTKLGLCRARPGGVDHRKGNRRRLRKRFRPQVITPIPDRLFSFSFSLYIRNFFYWKWFIRRCQVFLYYVILQYLFLPNLEAEMR